MVEKLVCYTEGQEPAFPSNYDVVDRKMLMFTDIIANKNKFYNMEIQVVPSGEARIYTVYGRVGAKGAKEYRVCSDRAHAEREAEKIVKSKNKKGYQLIKLAKSDIGSEVGKSKVEIGVSEETLKRSGVKVENTEPEGSKLKPEVADLVRTWFGITADFIELNLDTKKCPLGQLSLDQIAKAKDLLEEARTIVHKKKKDKVELNRLTSSYYTNIPHVLPRFIDADLLRFDEDTKIDKAFDILDIFADAKNAEKVISKKNAVDAQYNTLNAHIDWVDPLDPTWKWLDEMMHGTRARNHSGLGKLKTHKIYKVVRQDEDKHFYAAAEKIAKECGKFNPSEVYSKFLTDRPDLDKDMRALYKAANICPGWHGTRRANMVGITTKGLLIRPSGVIHAGSMYGDGIYWASNSTKSINYCDVNGSYWAQGSNKTAYLFLADVAYGNQEMARGSYMYTKNNIKPNHSVWAKAGASGVVNDEFITYTASGAGQQHHIRYIMEFETQVR